MPTEKAVLKSGQWVVYYGGGTAAPVTVTPPTASFTSVAETFPATYDFNATASSGGSAAITSYLWDFGDGSTTTGVQPKHTYTASGSYLVRLTVTNANGQATSTTTTLSVTVPSMPTAYFTVTTNSGGVWNRVDTDASSSTGTGLSYHWDFVQSTYDSTTPIAAGYIYNNAGDYTITLTVTDTYGRSATTNRSITITAPAAASTTGDDGGNGVQQSGAGIVAYNSAAGSDFSSRINSVGTTNKASLPTGTYSFNDFTFDGGGTSPTQFFFGAYISAGGILGAGSKYTVIQMTPNTSTKAYDVPAQSTGQSNQLQYMFFNAANVTVDGVKINGTSQGHLYNGLRFQACANPTLSDSTIFNIPGNYGAPPGETFGVNFQGSTGTVTVKNVTADGNGVGASIMGSNSSGATYNITNLLSQNCPYGSGWASWQHTGTMNFYNFIVKACAKAFNAERLAGVVNFYDPLWELPGGGGGNGAYDLNPSYDTGYTGGVVNFYFTSAANWNAFTANRGGANIKAITDTNSVSKGLKRSTVINVYVGGVKQTQANYVTWSGAGAGT